MLIELVTIMELSNDDSINFFRSTPNLIVSFEIWSWLCYEFRVTFGWGWEVVFISRMSTWYA